MDIEEVPEEDKYYLSSIGFDAGPKLRSGRDGVVFHGMCNENAEKRYVTDEYETTLTATGARYHRKIIYISLEGNKCAIKLLEPITIRYDELRWTLELNHPNIVDVYAVFTSGSGNAYIVMEFIEGLELYFLFEMDITQDRCLQITDQLVDGLLFLHTQGLLHNDLHSGNVIVSGDMIRDVGEVVVKYIDFGKIGPNIDGFTGDIKKLGFLLRRLFSCTEFENTLLKEFLFQLATDMRERRFEHMRNVRHILQEMVPQLLVTIQPSTPSPTSLPLTVPLTITPTQTLPPTPPPTPQNWVTFDD